MLFSAGCLTEAPARKWRWRHLERLPSQRRCSNPERLRVLIVIGIIPQSDIYLLFSQMSRCAPVERGKRTKSPSTASTSTRRFFTQPGILRWDLRPTIYHCYWSFLKPKSFANDFFSSPNVFLLMVSQTQILQENIIAVAATNNLFLFQVLIELSIIKDENSGSICYFPIFRRIISVCDDVSPP